MKSYKSILSLALIVSTLAFTGCSSGGGGGDEPEPNGNINLTISMYNSNQAMQKSIEKNTPETYNLNVVDLKGSNFQIKITSDNITDGVAESSIDWTTIYSSSGQINASSISRSYSMPAGTIRGLSIQQNNSFYWICSHNGGTIDIPDIHEEQLATNAAFVAIFGSTGEFTVTNGNIDKVGNNSFSPVTVTSGQTTNITIRINIVTVDWVDNDNSGDWTTGDEIENQTLASGTNNVVSFITN